VSARKAQLEDDLRNLLAGQVGQLREGSGRSGHLFAPLERLLACPLALLLVYIMATASPHLKQQDMAPHLALLLATAAVALHNPNIDRAVAGRYTS
jgi:hypothetical protein